MSLVSKFDELLAELEQRIQPLLREKDALLKWRREALEMSGEHQPELIPEAATLRPKSKLVIRDRQSPAERKAAEPRSKRDTMRAIAMDMDGEFCLPDLMAATKSSKLKLAPELTSMDWSATCWSFYKMGLLELVQPRKGNLPATYRRKTANLDIPESHKVKEFDLQGLTEEAVNALPEGWHTRKEVFEQMKMLHPELVERLNYDSVVATLFRISTFKRIRSEKQNGKNVYARIN